MLKLNDGNEERDDDPEQPQKPELPKWDQFPDIKIIPAIPDKPIPTPAEQSIISEIREGTPDIFRLPDLWKKNMDYQTS